MKNWGRSDDEIGWAAGLGLERFFLKLKFRF
jgi:phenylalanyl-tRNA synthetase alpha subunit